MSNVPAQADAVVIGSGASGLTAAVAMAEGGARIIVFEKERALGGSSSFLPRYFCHGERNAGQKNYVRHYGY